MDEAFFILVALATFIDSSRFFYTNYIALLVLLGIEVLAYIICFLKFRKEIATHSIASKVWTLILFATILEIMARRDSDILWASLKTPS